MRAHSLAFAAALGEASDGWLKRAAVFPEAATAVALEGTSALALMPYWREGRRLHGLATVTEGDLLPQVCAAGAAEARLAPLAAGPDGTINAIAVGNYPNDHHYPGPDWLLAPKSCRWGGRWQRQGRAISPISATREIPCLVPCRKPWNLPNRSASTCRSCI